MDIALYPDAPLTRKAKPFSEVNAEVVRLAEDMFETMYAYDGVGLAGPQVGVERRIFVLHDPDGEKMCLVNPEIELLGGTEVGEEGCLSLPNIFAPVSRATRIRVRAVTERGKQLEFEAEGFLARIIQHEYDHL
jgi:peptide deformylase